MQQLSNVLLRLSLGINGPFSEKIREDLFSKGWEALQQRPSLSPGNYTEAEQYYRDAILNDFARKSPLVKGDLHETAVKAFYDCERANKVTNDRLDRFLGLQGPFELHDSPFIELITRWRARVSDVLGKLPARLDLRLSSGATVGASGKRTALPFKLATSPVLYPQSVCLSQFVDETYWGRIHEGYKTSRGNHFFSVPKDSKKNRGCCKEALGSVSLQLALGQILRGKLADRGIDLNRGQDTHAKLARSASSGECDLATIDLSNASDLIAYKVVKLVLPQIWFSVFDSLRAPFTFIEGKWQKLEKFSSMGNGFTFELETLLFWTLVETCQDLLGIDTDVSVYGDDMIMSNDKTLQGLLKNVFTFFGFEINSQKSYSEGPFRESCGGDFFLGQAVRPYFQKKYPTSPADWFALHNGLVRLDRPELTALARDYCLQQLPSRLRKIRGPELLGDVVLHGFPREDWITTEAPTWDGFFIKVLQPQFKKLSYAGFEDHVQFACALYGLPSDGVIPRQEPLGYKLRKVYVSSRQLSGIPHWPWPEV